MASVSIQTIKAHLNKNTAFADKVDDFAAKVENKVKEYGNKDANFDTVQECTDVYQSLYFDSSIDVQMLQEFDTFVKGELAKTDNPNPPVKDEELPKKDQTQQTGNETEATNLQTSSITYNKKNSKKTMNNAKYAYQVVQQMKIDTKDGIKLRKHVTKVDLNTFKTNFGTPATYNKTVDEYTGKDGKFTTDYINTMNVNAVVKGKSVEDLKGKVFKKGADGKNFVDVLKADGLNKIILESTTVPAEGDKPAEPGLNIAAIPVTITYTDADGKEHKDVKRTFDITKLVNLDLTKTNLEMHIVAKEMEAAIPVVDGKIAVVSGKITKAKKQFDENNKIIAGYQNDIAKEVENVVSKYLIENTLSDSNASDSSLLAKLENGEISKNDIVIDADGNCKNPAARAAQDRKLLKAAFESDTFEVERVKLTIDGKEVEKIIIKGADEETAAALERMKAKYPNLNGALNSIAKLTDQIHKRQESSYATQRELAKYEISKQALENAKTLLHNKSQELLPPTQSLLDIDSNLKYGQEKVNIKRTGLKDGNANATTATGGEIHNQTTSTNAANISANNANTEFSTVVTKDSDDNKTQYTDKDKKVSTDIKSQSSAAHTKSKTSATDIKNQRKEEAYTESYTYEMTQDEAEATEENLDRLSYNSLKKLYAPQPKPTQN